MMFSFLGLIGILGFSSGVFAAADATLVNAMASSTSFFTDNSLVIVNYIVEIVLKLAGIALAFGAVYWIYRKIRSLFNK